MYQKIRKSVSANSVNQQKKSQFAPPSFKVQAKPYYPTNEKPGNQSEDLTVQGKEQNVSNPPEVKSGGSFADIPTLRPEIQERSSNEELSWVQRVFKAERTPNYPVNPYQAKLTIGQPGDKYEQEADRVANRIVRQINTPPTQSNHQQSLQRQEIKEQREKLGIQGRLAVGGREASQDLSSAINSARGRGQSLDAGLQQSMGQAMGADFSRVKIHTDAKSDQLNESIQAKAFTTGHDVFFRRGAYEPGSRGGQELIAHELTHVVQQNGNNIQAKPDTSDTVPSPYSDTVTSPYGVLSTEKEKGVSLQERIEKEKGVSLQERIEKEKGVSLQERIEFFKSLGVKNESEGGIPPKEEEGVSQERTEFLIDFFKSLGVKNKSKGGIPLGAKDLWPDTAPTEGENDNYEAPKEYKNVKERSNEYKGEDEDSGDFVNEKAILDAKLWARSIVYGDSVPKALQGRSGWSYKDVKKYYFNKEQPKVKYLDKESRKDYELIGGSTLRQGEPPIVFDTSEMFSKHSGKGFGIYVMSPDGKLYSHAHKVGLFHHSSFLAGLPTAGAGEIEVIGGKVQHITNKSGHYLPDQENMVQTLQEFKSRGVNLAGVKLTLMGGNKNYNAQEFLDEKMKKSV